MGRVMRLIQFSNLNCEIYLHIYETAKFTLFKNKFTLTSSSAQERLGKMFWSYHSHHKVRKAYSSRE